MEPRDNQDYDPRDQRDNGDRRHQTKERKDAKDSRPARQTRTQRPQRDARDARDPRDSRDARDPRDPRDQRDPRDFRDQRDPRDRDPRDYRDPRDFRDHRDPHGYPDDEPIDYPEIREMMEMRDAARRNRDGYDPQDGRSARPFTPPPDIMDAYDGRDYDPKDIKEGAGVLYVSSLQNRHITELIDMGNKLNIESANRLKKQDLVFAIVRREDYNGKKIIGEGTLEILPDGFGFLRSSNTSYLASPDDIYVSPSQIRRFNLHTGDSVQGVVRSPKENERYFALVKLEYINDDSPEECKNKTLFENLTPIFPTEQFHLDTELPTTTKEQFMADRKIVRDNNFFVWVDGGTDDLNEEEITLKDETLFESLKEGNTTGRIIDLVAPIGKGQRAIIVAPPKSGKTVMLKNIAQAILYNYQRSKLAEMRELQEKLGKDADVHDKIRKNLKLIVLLIDERPEEVTEMLRDVDGEVVASTFDEPATRHVQVAEMVIEKAKRLVEHGKDVVILLDSITRLARAYNTVAPSSGKILTGGVDANALHKPKRFFGAARNIEEGGSLTIIATALIDTGSRMDEVIYEEFKGTGNMELHLDRKLSERRIFPSINIERSGTRREELLYKDMKELIWAMRRICTTCDSGQEPVAFLIDKLKKSKTNKEFFDMMREESKRMGYY